MEKVVSFEQIWTTQEKYIWMSRHIIRPKRMLEKYRQLFPNQVFFGSYTECEQWIFEKFLKNFAHETVDNGATPPSHE
jgi:hypothetical protein